MPSIEQTPAQPAAHALANQLTAQAWSFWSQALLLSWLSALAWPSAAAVLGQQLRDSCIAHWGGGVPLDG